MTLFHLKHENVQLQKIIVFWGVCFVLNLGHINLSNDIPAFRKYLLSVPGIVLGARDSLRNTTDTNT